MLALLSGSPIFGQVARGDIELSFGTHLTRSRWVDSGRVGGAVSSWGVGGAVTATYFVRSRVDVGGRVGLSYSRSEGDLAALSSWSSSLGPIVQVHFRTKRKIVPLLGLSVGYTYGAVDYPGILGSIDYRLTTKGWYGEFEAGSDFFVSRSVAVRFGLLHSHVDQTREAPFLFLPSGVLIEERSVVSNETLVHAGLAFFLKRSRPGASSRPATQGSSR